MIGKKSASKLGGVGAALLTGVALAAVSPVLITATIDDTGMLHVSSENLIKGWFNQGNALDASKTNLHSVVTIGNSCSGLPTQLAYDSTADGFTPVTNRQGNTTAWNYSAELVDLTEYQNHWNYHHLCDGSTVVEGCQAALSVDVTMTALFKGGCRDYVNDSGATVCASDSKSLSLAAIQDPDVTDTHCVASTPAACSVGEVQICHSPPGNQGNPQTLCIGAAGLNGHSGHAGDHPGACP